MPIQLNPTRPIRSTATPRGSTLALKAGSNARPRYVAATIVIKMGRRLAQDGRRTSKRRRPRSARGRGRRRRLPRRLLVVLAGCRKLAQRSSDTLSPRAESRGARARARSGVYFSCLKPPLRPKPSGGGVSSDERAQNLCHGDQRQGQECKHQRSERNGEDTPQPAETPVQYLREHRSGGHFPRRGQREARRILKSEPAT